MAKSFCEKIVPLQRILFLFFNRLTILIVPHSQNRIFQWQKKFGYESIVHFVTQNRFINESEEGGDNLAEILCTWWVLIGDVGHVVGSKYLKAHQLGEKSSHYYRDQTWEHFQSTMITYRFKSYRKWWIFGRVKNTWITEGNSEIRDGILNWSNPTFKNFYPHAIHSFLNLQHH